MVGCVFGFVGREAVAVAALEKAIYHELDGPFELGVPVVYMLKEVGEHLPIHAKGGKFFHFLHAGNELPEHFCLVCRGVAVAGLAGIYLFLHFDDLPAEVVGDECWGVVGGFADLLPVVCADPVVDCFFGYADDGSYFALGLA